MKRETFGSRLASSLYLQDVPLVLEMCGSSRTCVDSSAGLHSF